ncbi:MAG: DUF2067 domain-containing protein [Asgard group archaeon]|nr:DUF2067 domain-containing protein [Asgard group archaeon]
MARWLSKEINLNIKTSKEAILLLDSMQKQIKIVDIIADYYPGKATIRLEGDKERLKEAAEMVKNIHLNVCGMLYPDAGNFLEYNITFLSKVSGKTFPVSVLMKILELLDYESFREGDNIVSKIKYDEILELINSLDQTLAKMPYEVATTSLRDFVAILAIVLKLSYEEVFTLGKKAKVVKEDDLNRLSLAVELDQALEKCLKLAKQ